MRIQKIAELCGYEFCGADRDVRNISYADRAFKDSLAIVHTRKDLHLTNAETVLIEPKFFNTDKSMLIISDPLDIAAVKIAKLLVQNGELKLYGRPIYHCVDGYFVADQVEVGEDTFISPGVFIDEGVKIGNRCRIDPNVQICGGTIIGNDVLISAGSVIGADAFCHYQDGGLRTFPGIGRAVIEDCVEIGCHTIVQRGSFSDTVIGTGSKIGNLIDIGHDVQIGKDCKIVSQTGIAGRVVIGNGVTVYGQVVIVNRVKIGDRAIVMAQSLVTKEVHADEIVSGRFARKHNEELRKHAEINRR